MAKKLKNWQKRYVKRSMFYIISNYNPSHSWEDKDLEPWRGNLDEYERGYERD